MALVRVYCGISSVVNADHVGMVARLTAAVADDSGRLLEYSEINDDPAGYAALTGMLAERFGGSTQVFVAIDSDEPVVASLLAASGRPIAFTDDATSDEFAERFGDDESFESLDGMDAAAAQRRAVGLARALQAGALSAGVSATTREFTALKPLLAAHSALSVGRQAAAVALREVLRELYPAALRAYPDPSDPVALAMLDALPEPALLTAAAGRGRDAAVTVAARLVADGVCDNDTALEAVTALRLAITETPRRAGVTKQLTAAVAEAVRASVAAVRSADTAGQILIHALTERVTPGGTAAAPPPPRRRPTPITTVTASRPVSPPPMASTPVSAAPMRVGSASVPVSAAPIPAGSASVPVSAAPIPAGSAQAPVSPPMTSIPVPAQRPAWSNGTPPPTPPGFEPTPVTGTPSVPVQRQPAPQQATPLQPMHQPAEPQPVQPMHQQPVPQQPIHQQPVQPQQPMYPQSAPQPVSPQPIQPSPLQPMYPQSAPQPVSPQPIQPSPLQPMYQQPAPQPVPQQPIHQQPVPVQGMHQPAPQPAQAVPSAPPAPAAAPAPPNGATGFDPLTPFVPTLTQAAINNQRATRGLGATRPDPVASAESRASWPLIGEEEDEAPAPVPAPARAERVKPPWQADDLVLPSLRLVDSEPPIPAPAAPPSLRLVEDPLTSPSVLDLPMHTNGNGNGNGRIPKPRRQEQSGPPLVEDDTDLLIFASVSSAWFSDEGEGESTWNSVMDAGWRAAEDASLRPTIGDSTHAGLPQRVPQANLVPGAPINPERPLRIVRDAGEIAAHTSSYFRGWRRGTQEAGGYSVGGRPGRESASGWDFSREHELRDEREDYGRRTANYR